VAKSFSIQDLETFHQLKSRESQLLSWQDSIAEEMAKLERQQAHQEQELKELRREIKKNFAALDGNPQLFREFRNAAVHGINPENVKKGMSLDQKKRLLPSIIADYVALNPDSTNVPFTWIKSHLESKHGISCRSISNFFVGILDEYELEGGNRNRSIVVED
jgi:hypothetical protein